MRSKTFKFCEHTNMSMIKVACSSERLSNSSQIRNCLFYLFHILVIYFIFCHLNMSKKCCCLFYMYMQFSIRENFNKFDSVAKSFKSMFLSLTFQSGSVQWTFFESPLCLLILCNDCWYILYWISSDFFKIH